MDYRKLTSALAAAALLGLVGCATPYDPNAPQYPTSQTYPPGQYPTSQTYPDYQTARYGYVESVEALDDGRSGPGIGAIGGAIAGGVLGNQVGHGSGRAAATVGGAVVGGVIGHKVEEHIKGRQAQGYRLRVRMDDGSYQTYTQDTHHNLRAGDRVRVENGRVFPS